MNTVTLSDQAKAVAALEEEKRILFADAEQVSKDQELLVQAIKGKASMHHALLRRIIAIEEAQAKLLMPL